MIIFIIKFEKISLIQRVLFREYIELLDNYKHLNFKDAEIDAKFIECTKILFDSQIN